MASNVPIAPAAIEIKLAQPVGSPPQEEVDTDRTVQEPLNTSPLSTGTPASPGRQRLAAMADKVLSTTASLSQLLPTGTVLAYHSLSSSFANLGSCYPSNKWLSVSLIGACALSCILFTFTDSVRGGDGKPYYGIAWFTKLILLNYNGSDEDNVPSTDELKKYRLRLLHGIYAFLSVLLFLAVAFGDVAVSRCFFPDAGPNAKQLLLNLPLGAALLSSTFFLVFPTHRKGIGYTNTLGLPEQPAR